MRSMTATTFIITSENLKSESEIIYIYRGLWRIEESFKVRKSELDTRPICVGQTAHRAHFLVCYVALTIGVSYRPDFDYKYSAKRIFPRLASSSLAPDKATSGTSIQDCPHDELCANAGITVNREIMTLKDIKSEIAKTRKH